MLPPHKAEVTQHSKYQTIIKYIKTFNCSCIVVIRCKKKHLETKSNLLSKISSNLNLLFGQYLSVKTRPSAMYKVYTKLNIQPPLSRLIYITS